jgi:DNA-binding MarR family transcriptional regulator
LIWQTGCTMSGAAPAQTAPAVLTEQSAPTDGVLDPRQSLEALLTEVSALALRLKQLVRTPHASGALAAGGLSILQLLERNGDAQTVPQLARTRLTSRQNIQTLVNRLREEGCVELARNPAHKRSVLVRPTERGKALRKQGAAEEAGRLEAVLAQLPEAELRSATRLLGELRRLLGEPTSGPGVERAKSLRKVHAQLRRRIRKGSAQTPTSSPEPAEAPDTNELPVSLL